VVIAETEVEARRFAHKDVGGDELINEKIRVWMDPALSTCEELKATDKAGVVMRDFNAG
jgi:hypothetical protein